MGRRVAALVLAVAGCRGEPAPASEKPEPTEPPPSEPAKPQTPEPVEDEPRTSEPDIEERPVQESPIAKPLESGAVAAHLQKHWPAFSAAHVTDRASAKMLDGLVADGKPSVATKSCAEAAKAANAVLDNGNDLLYGDIATVAARSGDCWAVHVPGMMGPSLELVLRTDGEVLLAIMILEG